MQWFNIEPCYVFHPINAYDDGSKVVIDVVRHPKMFATDFFGPNEGAPATWRYVLDRATGTATESPLNDRAVEFPRVDERLVGRKHRFSWTVEVGLDSGGDVVWPGTGLVRHDARTGTSEVRRRPGPHGGRSDLRAPRARCRRGRRLVPGVRARRRHRPQRARGDRRPGLAGRSGRHGAATARVPLGFHGNRIWAGYGRPASHDHDGHVHHDDDVRPLVPVHGHPRHPRAGFRVLHGLSEPAPVGASGVGEEQALEVVEEGRGRRSLPDVTRTPAGPGLRPWRPGGRPSSR